MADPSDLHAANLRKGRLSQLRGLYYITKCTTRPFTLTSQQRTDVVGSFFHFRELAYLLLHAFVVMPDHWHALFTLGDGRPSVKASYSDIGGPNPFEEPPRSLGMLVRDLDRR